MAVFIEKSPFTSSNCYKIIKTASIPIKLGTNIDWTTAFVTTCSVLNFLLPWQPGDIYEFSIKIGFAAPSQWIEIETESKAFQCWLHVTL
jgi:hypothetical protein